MFSGIIERLAPVRRLDPEGASLRMALDTGYPDLDLGESVAVNGVCLTVTAHAPDGRAEFFLSPETLARTAMRGLTLGDLVNLERSVRLETRLSGHMVQGHVDGEATLLTAVEEAGAHRLTFALHADLARYCVVKGSIALNGISLTINALRPAGEQFQLGVTIIPHTWTHTNLHALAPGHRVNVEVDVIAKYVERLCQPYLKP